VARRRDPKLIEESLRLAMNDTNLENNSDRGHWSENPDDLIADLDQALRG
jgi:hypothetical protein